MTRGRPPETWRTLPLAQRRGVIKDARRGVGPSSPAVATAASEWAGWALERSWARVWLIFGGFAAVVGAIALVEPRALFALVGAPAVLAAVWWERRDARNVRRSLGRQWRR